MSVLTQVKNQKGFSLPLSLIFALVLILTALSVGKKVFNSGNAVMGVTLRQAAANGGDRGMMTAASWLNNNATILTADNANLGYYAEELKNVDWTGLLTPTVATDDVNWDGSNNSAALTAYQVPGTDDAGNNYAYVIQRLCNTAGAYSTTSGVQCNTFLSTSIPADYRQGETYNAQSITTSTMLYYRITVRTYNTGTGAVSYTQSLVLVST